MSGESLRRALSPSTPISTPSPWSHKDDAHQGEHYDDGFADCAYEAERPAPALFRMAQVPECVCPEERKEPEEHSPPRHSGCYDRCRKSMAMVPSARPVMQRSIATIMGLGIGVAVLPEFRLRQHLSVFLHLVAHYWPGPLTVNSSVADNGLPSSVQTAPGASQSSVTGSSTVTSPLEAGSTTISQPMLLPLTSRRT